MGKNNLRRLLFGTLTVTGLLVPFSLTPVEAISNYLHTNALLANADSGASDYADADNYYSGIDDSLTGENLMVALSTLTSSGFVSHSYSSLPDIYQYSDVDSSHPGKMRMVYTNSYRTFSAGSMPSSSNKEHVWPASWYGNGTRTESAGSPGADAFNVWPADSGVNSKRGSSAFDELSFGSSYKVPELGSYDYGDGTPDSYVYSSAFNNSNGQNDDQFYPAAGERGKIARILMYVATRYKNNSTYVVTLHDNNVTLKEGYIGKLSVLLKWHYLEPPGEFEIARNQTVAERWHHARNPFIDHPEYAARIYQYLPEPNQSAPTEAVLNAIATYSEPVAVESVSVSSLKTTIGINMSTQMKAEVLPTNASEKGVTWESSNPTVATVSSSGLVSGKMGGTTVIKATTNDGGKVDSLTITVDPNLVAATGISITPDVVNLDIGQETSIEAMVLPANASNKTINWSSSAPSVASVDENGLVKGIKKGIAVLTATSEDGGFTDTVKIQVATDGEPYLWIDSTGADKYIPYMSVFAPNGIVAHYVDDLGEDSVITDYTYDSIDTSKLGQQEVTIRYQGLVGNYDILVTNDGAEANPSSTTQDVLTISSGFPTSYPTSETTYELEGHDFTLKNVANFSSSIQVKKGSGVSAFYNNKALSPMTSIILTKTGSSAGVPNLFVGSSQNPSTAVSPVISGNVLTYTVDDATFFKITGADSGVSNLASITIDYSAQGAAFTGEDQAQAYAQYFIDMTKDECLALNVSLTNWDQLTDEYSFMLDEAKDTFIVSNDEVIASARARYQFIVNKYGYEPFATDSSGNLLSVRDGREPLATSNPWMMLILGIGFAGIISLLYFVNRSSKKSN
ncbi:MAG: Ig-like domain-containing protein [Bacilli bacterium]